MGLFDFLSKKDPAATLKKHAERVANKRAQAPDRWESIIALVGMASEESIEALLPRFSFYIDPSITDQEEKDAAFDGIVSAGAVAVKPVKALAARSESLSWPLKMLDRLLTPDEVRATLLGFLAELDTEYERDPQRKVQLLAEFEARTAEDVLAVVLPFLEDVNETARFHAVGAVLAQPNAEEAREALSKALAAEESMRVKARVLEAFVAREWPLAGVETGPLPEGFAIDAAGVASRR